MTWRLRALFTIGALAALPAPLAAQAFTSPAGVGQITLGYQYVDNTGHRFSDGYLISLGDSVTMSLFIAADYAITDRLSASAGIPFVSAKYTGGLPPASRLSVDECQCWHSSLQDLTVGARYRFGNDAWAVTPNLRYVLPSHDYRYEGEAVAGRNLEEVQVGIHAGTRLRGILRDASILTSYEYSFVERPIRDISINRSNASFEVGYALTKRWYVRGTALWQETHGGARIGSPSGKPFFPPGELNTPDRWLQRDRLISTQYWHAGAGVSFAAGPVDLFASYTKYITGRNTHDGHAYTTGITWYFDRSKF
ncbi:MAG TPA: hypothetical protein VFL80_06320 [Thermoanaerobaculia bacterium]|nr:hypothetical protein [Thermoanaerobaculia bacterium]